MNLKEENILLKQKLDHAQEWMHREVFAQSSQSQRDIIYEKISSFFPPETLLNFPENAIDSLISSEIIFQNQSSYNFVDGSSIILGYQKVLDGMIELYITGAYRHFSVKNNLIHSPENIPLEKALNSVITQNYSLSIGRLYQILQDISLDNVSGYYENNFLVFLNQQRFLKKALLKSDFLLQLGEVIQLGALGEKRHSGFLCQKETQKTRNILCGNFEDTNCLLFLLADLQSTGI